jgi:hypothetical protein
VVSITIQFIVKKNDEKTMKKLRKILDPRLCGRFARRSAKMVLGSQPTEFNLDKFPLL